jgi:hypothetical protein
MCCIQVIEMRPTESMTLQMFQPFTRLAAALLHPSADDEDGRMIYLTSCASGATRS